MDKIFGLKIDEIYWNLKIGKSKRRANAFEVRENLNNFIKKPVFFLSTGRCGTKWFSELINTNKAYHVLHSPVPSFALQNRIVRSSLISKVSSEDAHSLLKEIYLTGREPYLRHIYKADKRYIESNNYITFFAPVIAEIFPDALFVHLYRHPGEFVRSGLRRGYYETGNVDDLKRPLPPDNEEDGKGLSRIGKVSWLWTETNQFIENFKLSYPTRCMDFNFNDLTVEKVSALMEFLEIEINNPSIVKFLRNRVNVQRKGDFKAYADWSEEEREALRFYCAELAQKYGYEI